MKTISTKLIAILALICLGVSTFRSSSNQIQNQVIPIVYADANPGAIWTTNSSCGGVNINLFASKADVYLNGGPNGGSSNGLPDGNYFVKVTDPSGSPLLGHISASGAVVVSGGHFNLCYNLFTLTAFTDTPNNGGEYKVWVSQSDSFDHGDVKTDNFKVSAASVSPSASPSVSPSASPSTSPSVEPSASPSISPSVEPSASPSVAPSDNNSTNNNNSNNSNNNSSNNSSSTNNSEGQVLGAYAKTGVVEDVIINTLGSLGGLMTVAGSVLYGQKKTKRTR